MVNTNDFKTKTYMKQKANIGTDKAWVVAMDIGYSSVKAMSKSGLFSFPAFATRVTDDRVMIGEALNEDIQYRDENNNVWDVGERAVSRVSQTDNSNSEEMLYSRNRYSNPMFLVLARVGIALGLQSYDKSDEALGSNLVLQTGLPPAYLKSDSRVLKKILSGKHEFYLKIGNSGWRKYSFELNENNIKIMGQPMGSLFSVIYGDDGKEIKDGAKYMKNDLLIFDGGFGTLDTFEIRNRTIGAMQTFDFLGMKAVLHRASEIIFRQYEEEIAVSAMQNVLRNGFITQYDYVDNVSKKIDIQNIIESANREICNEAITQIRQIYNNLIDYRYLLVTGGTGEAWFDMIKEFFSKIEGLEVVAANQNTNIPQIFSNVRGYYLYCVNKLNKG